MSPSIDQYPVYIYSSYISHSIPIIQPQHTQKSYTTSFTKDQKFDFIFFVHPQFLVNKGTGFLDDMAIRMPRIIQASQILKRSLSGGRNPSASMDIPKGYFAIYVGEQEKKRFVVSISLLSQPAFQELLHQAEEEFGYNHPMGGLTIPCSEDVFTHLASRLGAF